MSVCQPPLKQFFHPVQTYPTSANLFAACRDGDAAKAEGILKVWTGMNINFRNTTPPQEGFTCLLAACYRHHTEVARLLLRQPGIDPNCCCNGRTPLQVAMAFDNFELVAVLLADHRVHPGMAPGNPGNTTLLINLVANNRVKCIKYLIASGKKLEPSTKTAADTTIAAAIKLAAKNDLHEIFILLLNYLVDPGRTIWQQRRELQFFPGGDVPEQVLAMVVLLSDGLVAVPQKKRQRRMARFFAITARLPLEMQMLVCNLYAGSTKALIPSKVLEPAFRHLATTL